MERFKSFTGVCFDNIKNCKIVSFYVNKVKIIFEAFGISVRFIYHYQLHGEVLSLFPTNSCKQLLLVHKP